LIGDFHYIGHKAFWPESPGLLSEGAQTNTASIRNVGFKNKRD